MALTKQMPIRMSDTIRERLDKLAAWRGTECAEVVRGLINREYQANKVEIEKAWEELQNNE